MPIYEYECMACDKITSSLILKPEEEALVCCEHCGENDIKRIISRCTAHKTESQRLNNFNTQGHADEGLKGDPRNVGLWAKKRTKELGVDLGSTLDETIDRARSGKVLD
jgi:putative FmdB family regulatory protein